MRIRIRNTACYQSKKESTNDLPFSFSHYTVVGTTGSVQSRIHRPKIINKILTNLPDPQQIP